MKVIKTVSVEMRIEDSRVLRMEEADVEINITGGEAVAAILEHLDGCTEISRLKGIVNNLATTLKSFNDSTIVNLGPDARQLVSRFLREQALRFWPEGDRP